MKVRILACGGDGMAELLSVMATPDAVVKIPPSKSGKIYVTETADYILCPFQPESCKNFFDEVNRNFNVCFDATDPETCDMVWYGLPVNRSCKIPPFVRKFPGRMVVVLTQIDESSADDLQHSLSTLVSSGISRTKIISVSAKSRVGFVQLIRTTAEMLRTKTETDEKIEKEISYQGRNRIVLPEHPDADSFIRWAAGRAFAIAAIPLPLADVAPLFANEAYMIYKLGQLYGYTVDKTMVANFVGCIGASLGGMALTSFVPFLKAPVAAAVTYGIGKAAKAYFESGMTLDGERLGEIFQRERNVAKDIEW